MIYFILIWIICGFICAAIAGYKDLNAHKWFWIGILTGIIGVIFALLATNKQVEQVLSADTFKLKQEKVDSGFKKCPYCAEIIRVEAIKCRHCGSEIKIME